MNPTQREGLSQGQGDQFSSAIPDLERQVQDDEEQLSPELDEAGETRQGEADFQSQAKQKAEEDEARASGWVGKDEWDGPPEKWKPAAEFLAFRDHVLPLVQRENRALRAEVAELKAWKEQQGRERAEYLRQIEMQNLRQQLREARESGDSVKEDEVLDKIVGLKVQAPAQNTQTAPAVDPNIKAAHDEFVSRNTWLKDKQLNREFYRQLKLIADTNTADDVNDALAQAKNTVRRMYPEMFKPASAMAESSASHQGRAMNGRSWDRLKPDIRQNYDNMLRNLGLSGKDLEASRKRILDSSEDIHFRR